MTVQVQCPACGKTAAVPEAMLQRKGRCVQCGARFVIAATADGDQPKAHETRIAADAARQTADAPPPSHNGEKVKAAPPGADGLPSRIGRFEIRERLGAGAFGTVYRAYDPQLDREVALKVPQAGVLNNPTRVERFLREARSAAQLRHPHIVPVYDAGRDGDRYYIASAFIAGRTLAEALDDKPMAFRRAARIARELADALEHAHGQRIVHRDVKPANVMLDAQDRPQLMDFGLAHRHDVEDKLTHDGAVLGTPAYMAPEQAGGKSGEAGPASDQYSLGVVLYQMLTGRLPFTGPAQVVMYNVLNVEPPPPRKFNPKAPIDLETICLKAMAKRPNDRYASCGEMADDLRRSLEGEPIQARRMGLAERMMRWGRRNPALAIAGGAVAACVAAVAVIATVYAGWLAVSERRANDERDKTTAALKKAEQAADAEAAAHRDADAQRKKAEDALTDAAARLSDAEAQRKKAEDALAAAEEAKGKAQAALADAERERAQTAQLAVQRRAQEYAAYPTLLRQGRLNECQEDLRGWEWRHLQFTQLAGEDSVYILDPENQTESEMARPRPLVFSPDGKRLASACGPLVKISWGWGPMSDTKLFRFTQHTRDVVGLAFSPDGQRILSCAPGGGWDEKAKKYVGSEVWVWDAATGNNLVDLGAQDCDAGCAAFSPNGRWIAYGCTAWDSTKQEPGANEVRLFEAGTGKEIRRFQGHQGKICAIRFGPAGQWLATASEDHTVKIWDPATGEERLTFSKHAGKVVCLACSEDGRVASGDDSGVAKVWDAATGKVLFDLSDANRSVCSLDFSPDGERIAACTLGAELGDGSESKRAHLRIFDGRSGTFLMAMENERPASRLTWGEVAFSPNGQRLAGWTSGGLADAKSQIYKGFYPTVWESAPQEGQILFVGHGGKILDLTLDKEGKRLATASADKSARIWDAATGKELATLVGHGGAVTGVAFSPDGKTLATSSEDGTVKIWDLATNKETFTFHGHTGAVLTVAFGPDGTWIASAALEVKIWDVATGHERVTIKHHSLPGLRLSPDGKWVAGVEGYNWLRVWDTATGKEAYSIHNVQGCPVFSPDSKCIAASRWSEVPDGNDLQVDVWDAETGRWLRRLHPPGAIDCLAYSPDGKRIGVFSSPLVMIPGRRCSFSMLDAETGKRLCLFSVPDKSGPLVFGRDSSWIYYSGPESAKACAVPKD